jgi:hypothetical protein
MREKISSPTTVTASSKLLEKRNQSTKFIRLDFRVFFCDLKKTQCFVKQFKNFFNWGGISQYTPGYATVKKKK